MDPFDTGTSTDLVVAEGSTLRGGLHNSKHRPMGSTRLEQAVPLHFLHSSIPNYHGARLYSSSTSSFLPQAPEEQPAEDLQTNVNPDPSPTPKLSDGPDAGFASLRGLFGNPRKSWSPPQTQTRETDAIADVLPERSAQTVGLSDSPFGSDLSDQVAATAEEKDEKAHEMLSSVPTIKAQNYETSAEQPKDTNDAKVGLESLSPLPRRKRIARDGSESSTQTVPVIRFKKASKGPKANRAIARNIEAGKNVEQLKPKPLPAWKVGSEDTQLPTPLNKRKVNTSTASASVQSVQSSSLPSNSPARADVEQSESSPAQLVRFETDFLDSMESTRTTPSSSVVKAESPDAASTTTLTHLTSTGEAHMVDVGSKDPTERIAVAVGFVHFSKEGAYKAITENLNKKGDVLGVARIAGIMAAKRCSDIIPLCHPIPITNIKVNVGTMSTQNAKPIRTLLGSHTIKHGIAAVEARVHTRGQTGVEMEALTAVSGACLTIYDMCKAVDKDMVISGARILYKDGGRSGTYIHKDCAKQPLGDRFISMDQNVSMTPSDK